jgi:hypothetical protein
MSINYGGLKPEVMKSSVSMKTTILITTISHITMWSLYYSSVSWQKSKTNQRQTLVTETGNSMAARKTGSG